MTDPLQVDHGWLLVGYSEDQAGQAIRQDDVIRANNGRWFTQEEVSNFKNKSNDSCPMYGNCNRCWKSGPVGKACNECNDKKVGYEVIFIFPQGERSGD